MGADRRKRQGPDRGGAGARSRLGGLIGAAILAACTPQAPAAKPIVEDGSQQGLREIPLTIRSAKRTHRFTVELAVTPQQQQMGLMFRRLLPPNHGMLFPHETPRPVSFWMKNTVIPLDMIFIGPDGRIIRIATARPLNLELVPSGGPTAAVLEIPGGRARQLGIRVGDRVSYRL